MIFVVVALFSGQVIAPVIESSAVVLGGDVSSDLALVATAVVFKKSGVHGMPEVIEIVQNSVTSVDEEMTVAVSHPTDPGVFVIAASVIVSKHVVELVPVGVLGLKHRQNPRSNKILLQRTVLLKNGFFEIPSIFLQLFDPETIGSTIKLRSKLTSIVTTIWYTYFIHLMNESISLSNSVIFKLLLVSSDGGNSSGFAFVELGGNGINNSVNAVNELLVVVLVLALGNSKSMKKAIVVRVASADSSVMKVDLHVANVLDVSSAEVSTAKTCFSQQFVSFNIKVQQSTYQCHK